MNLRILFLACVVFFAGLIPGVEAQAQPYGGGGAVDCVSRNYNYSRCPVPWEDARIVRQISGAQCVRGQNWGFERRGGFIWVDRGCSASFVPVGGYGHGPGYGGGWQPGPGWDNRFQIACESRDNRYSFCAVDLGGGGRAYLERQTSGSPCIEGRTWGWNRAGIWIQDGCRGVFTVDRRWR
jgi:hypothetical protein